MSTAWRGGKRIFAECCYQPWCSHYPRSGPDPLQAAAKRTHSPGERHVTEAHVQARLVQALRDAGYSVWRCGQYNARRTQDAGVPDIIALRERVLFVECKRPHRGELSVPQQVFQAACESAGVAYVVASSLVDVQPYLTREG